MERKQFKSAAFEKIMIDKYEETKSKLLIEFQKRMILINNPNDRQNAFLKWSNDHYQKNNELDKELGFPLSTHNEIMRAIENNNYLFYDDVLSSLLNPEQEIEKVLSNIGITRAYWEFKPTIEETIILRPQKEVFLYWLSNGGAEYLKVFIFNMLFKHEIQILNNGLSLLGISFEEYFAGGFHSVEILPNEISLDIIKLPQNPVIERALSLENLTPEQENIIDAFGKLMLLKIPFILTTLFIRDGFVELALDYVSFSIKTMKSFKERLQDDWLPELEDKLNNLINRKIEIEKLIENQVSSTLEPSSQNVIISHTAPVTVNHNKIIWIKTKQELISWFTAQSENGNLQDVFNRKIAELPFYFFMVSGEGEDVLSQNFNPIKFTGTERNLLAIFKELINNRQIAYQELNPELLNKIIFNFRNKNGKPYKLQQMQTVIGIYKLNKKITQ